jgi:hypothetical protein
MEHASGWRKIADAGYHPASNSISGLGVSPVKSRAAARAANIQEDP